MPVTSNKAQVVQLEERLQPFGYDVSRIRLLRVLQHMNWDVDLAVTAFCMIPRPSWLLTITGPIKRSEKK
jgi:hypothetical protein